jgi:hypothetical protein
MSKQIFRTAIAADGHWHTVEMVGPIVHVATRSEDHVEAWFVHDPSIPAELRALRVFGTGEEIPPAAAIYIGTAVTPSGRFVWHLMEHERTGGAA